MPLKDYFRDEYYADVQYKKELRAEMSEEERRVEQQLKYYNQLMNLPKPVTSDEIKKKLNLTPEEYMMFRKGSWKAFDVETSTLKLPNVKETKAMAVFNVIVTRKLTIPQADGALLQVERILADKTVVAQDSNTAALIAGKGLEGTDEELSLASVKVTQKA